MPRRPAIIEQDIPLFLIPHIVKRGVRTHGEGLERVTVSRTAHHFYMVSIRTRPIKRELKSRPSRHRATELQKSGEKGETK